MPSDPHITAIPSRRKSYAADQRASITNQLLSALPRKDYRRMFTGLEPVNLNFGEVLYEPGDPIGHVYFPGTVLVSLMTLVDDRLTLEVGVVGCEGMVGLPVALGIGVSPFRALVQGAGTAMRMKSSWFVKELRQSTALQRALQRYTHTLMAQFAQTAACNRFHVVEERLARWLLITRDRVQSTDFRLTQEFLSHMLGVRRVGVTKAAGHLQQRRLIEYSRGNIRIVDQPGLEAASCSCYRANRNSHIDLV